MGVLEWERWVDKEDDRQQGTERQQGREDGNSACHRNAESPPLIGRQREALACD
jgi:hypothetical protein